jgi:hypothetical protein
VTVDTVVAGIQSALYEPCIVTTLKASGVDSLEIAFPREQFACKSSPELLWLCDGLLVQLLVLLEAVEMRF